jgi:hypothetical protein
MGAVFTCIYGIFMKDVDIVHTAHLFGTCGTGHDVWYVTIHAPHSRTCRLQAGVDVVLPPPLS